MRTVTQLFRQFRVGPRLAISLGSVLAVLCAVFAALHVSMQARQGDTDQIRATAARRSDVIRTLKTSQLEMVSAIRNAGLQQDAAVVNSELERAQALIAQIRDAESSLRQDHPHERATALLEKMSKQREAVEAYGKEAADLTLSFSGDVAARILTGKFWKASDSWQSTIRELEQFFAEVDAQEVGESVRRAALQYQIGTALLVATLLAAVAAGVLVTRTVTGPLLRATLFAREIASGNLTSSIEVEGNDELTELARALQTMGMQLRQLIRDLQLGSRALQEVSSEFSNHGMALSDRTSRQAASLEQTAAAMEEISATAATNSQSIDQARALAAEASQSAVSGQQAIQGVIAAIDEISKQSSAVAEITQLVDQLAFQVNVLSLNAAVEAARAGSHGRGFAVVAAEVRSLAQRSAAAAQDIRGLIETSSKSVGDGQQRARGAGQTIQGLTDKSHAVRLLMEDVTRAISEQARGIQQINTAIADLDRGTQDNAALVERTAATSKELEEHASALSKNVHAFVL